MDNPAFPARCRRPFVDLSCRMFKSGALVCTLLSTQVLFADDVGDSAATRVAETIGDAKVEIASLPDHPWAGEYYAGDGLGMNLRLWVAPRAGAAFQWHGCLGLYEQNFGTAKSDGPYLSIDWRIKGADPYVTDTRYIVTRIRKSIFLVPTHDVHRFCLGARGLSPMPAMVLSSQSARNRQTLQRPALPAEYQVYIDLDPIHASVLSVNEPEREKMTDKLDLITQTVILNAGKDKHLFVGMRFEAMKPKLPDRVVTITDVRATKSTAVSETRRQTGKYLQPVKKRWRFHTATR